MRTNRAEESEVFAVPCPEWTDTFHPVSHKDLVTTIESEVKDYGMGIVRKQYSMSENGMRLFGTFELDGNESTKQNWMLGIRQALDKSMAIGICAGLTVFVCDNMDFDGEYIQFRKHTGGLNDETLRYLVQDAIDKMINKMIDLETWRANLQNYYITPRELEMFTYKAMTKKALPPSKFNEFHKAIEVETDINHGYRTLQVLHNGFTRTLKGNSLFNVADACKKEITLINEHIEWRSADQYDARLKYAA